MYTGFQIKVLLKDNPRAIAALIDLGSLKGAEGLEYKPFDDWFFKCDRASMLFRCTSSYFPEPEYNTGFKLKAYDEGWYLEVGSSLKNYSNEIGKFLRWVSPFVDPREEGKVVGKYMYEASENPTPIIFGGK